MLRRSLWMAVLALGWFPAIALASESDPMRFEIVAEPPVCPKCVVVSMSGEVVESTSIDFATFVARERLAKRLPKEPRRGEPPDLKTPTVYVALDSIGGNVMPALVIGRRIRELGWNTIVARPRLDDAAGVLFEPAGCYSACSMMMLGGIERLVLPRSKAGVHQFSPEFDDEESYSAVQMREAIRDYGRTVKTVYDYVQQMGVGNEYFIASMGTPFASMNVVPESDWLTLGIATRRIAVKRNATIADVLLEAKQRVVPAAKSVAVVGKPSTAIDGIWTLTRDAGSPPRVNFAARDDVTLTMSCQTSGVAKLDVRFEKLDAIGIERLRAAAFALRRMRIGDREVSIGAVPPSKDETQTVSLQLDRRDLAALADSVEPFVVAVIDRNGVPTPRAAQVSADGIGPAMRDFADACSIR